MPQLSKLVTDRVKSSRAVVAAGKENLSAIVTAATERHGEKLADAASVIVETMVGALEKATADMEAADLEHAAELGDDPAARARRDEASAKARTVLLEVRGAVTTAYGSAYAKSLGFVGDTPDDPQQMLHLLRGVGPRLKTRELPEQSLPGVTIDIDVMQQRIAEVEGPLAAALDEVAREERQAQGTLAKKNASIRAYDDAFRQAASLISGMLDLAGLEALAARVRPSVARPGRTVADAREVGTEEPLATPTAAEPVSEPA